MLLLYVKSILTPKDELLDDEIFHFKLFDN